MDEYDDIYFLDEYDARNARPRVRTSSAFGPRPSLIRPDRVMVPAVPSRSYPIAPARPRAVVVAPAPVPAVTERRSILGNLSTGELVEIAAQVLSAIQALPGAPVATGHGPTDTENLITYQQALAAHAKRVEQVRTLGSVLGKLLA